MGTTATAERRDPSAPRRPLRTTVDLMSGDEREAWQADVIDASVRGMSMRASVLPEVGETLGMKLKPDAASSITARGEVVWAADKGTHAGAFGVRFTEMTPAAEQALQRMLDGGRREDAPRPAPPPADARVKLFIQGMDAPLRARVRRSEEGEVVVGSDLSFLKLGDKVDVDGAGSKVNGTIVKVDVEVDPKTRVPRLVLSIDLGGKKRPADIATAETMLAESPRASDPELPAVKPVTAREHAKPVKTAALAEPVVAPEAHEPPSARVSRRAAQATNVLDEQLPETAPDSSQPDGELNLDEPPPGWITQGMRSFRNVADRVQEKAGPVMRKAAGAVGAFTQRMRNRNGAEHSDAGDEAPAPRRGLRPQHAASRSAVASDSDAITTQPGRNRKIGLYAVVGLVVAAGIVAYATSSGPKVETPHPQVAVTAEGNAADPNAAPVDPNAATAANAAPSDPAPEGEGEPTTPTAAPREPRWVAGRTPRTPDLAAAATSPNAQGDGEAPVIETPPARPMRPAAQRPMAAPLAQRPMAPVAQRPVTAPLMQRPVAAPAMQRPAVAPVVAQGPARPVVFGNPAVRNGTVLRLRMDGPIGAIQGVGARGAQIVLSVPGRHSLDMAAPLATVDPRLSGAGIYNRATGAELTLRFRAPAPPFVARSRGNTLEIVLAPTPGQPVRAAARLPVVVSSTAPRR